MILHCNEFKNEEARQQIKDIQDSSITCLIKILKFYKVIFFSCHHFKIQIICKQFS